MKKTLGLRYGVKRNGVLVAERDNSALAHAVARQLVTKAKVKGVEFEVWNMAQNKKLCAYHQEMSGHLFVGVGGQLFRVREGMTYATQLRLLRSLPHKDAVCRFFVMACVRPETRIEERPTVRQAIAILEEAAMHVGEDHVSAFLLVEQAVLSEEARAALVEQLDEAIGSYRHQEEKFSADLDEFNKASSNPEGHVEDLQEDIGLEEIDNDIFLQRPEALDDMDRYLEEIGGYITSMRERINTLREKRAAVEAIRARLG